MESQMKTNTKDLEQRLVSLQKNLAFANDSSGVDSSELFKIIHRPGWTTPVQVLVAGGILDAMNQQAAALRGLGEALQQHIDASVGR
jgi:hypothetical protein